MTRSGSLTAVGSPAEMAGRGVFVTRQAYVDHFLIPMRVPLPPGQLRRVGTLDEAQWVPFDPAPAWAATLVDRLARAFLQEVAHRGLALLTRQLLSSEALALSAHVVLNSILPELDQRYDASAGFASVEERVDYGIRRTRAYEALERLAWSVPA